MATVKRLRVRLKANDIEGVARTFKTNLSKTGVFIKTSKPLDPGTQVKVELLFASGDAALSGRGTVSWVRDGAESGGPAGLAIDLVWDAESSARVDQILSTPISPDAAHLPMPIVDPVTIPPGMMSQAPGPQDDLQIPAPRLSELARAAPIADLDSQPPGFASSPPAIVSMPPTPAAATPVAVLDGLQPRPIVPSVPPPPMSDPIGSSAPPMPASEPVEAVAPNAFAPLPPPDLTAFPSSPPRAVASVPPPPAMASVPPPAMASEPPPPAMASVPPPALASVPPPAMASEPPPPPPAMASVPPPAMASVPPPEPAPAPSASPLAPAVASQPAPADGEMVIERNEVPPSQPPPPAAEPVTADEAPAAAKKSRRAGDLWSMPPPDPNAAKQELATKSRFCIGIDLGTTNSCAAIHQDGKARVLPSRRGNVVIPSVIALDGEGNILVGEPALRQVAINPANTIIGSKRLIGRDFHAPVVDEVRGRFAYQIVEGPNGEAAVQLGERVMPLEEVAAHLLREIRESVSLQLKEDVNRAVITCPAYFQERQRQAIRTAGEKAGFHVERVLAEPTAAALNYGFGRSLSRRRILVYDLGGGTFDASLMEVEGDVYEVLASGGDSFLGGIDFDERLTRLLVKEIKTKYALDPRTDDSAMGRLAQSAERAKRDLTDHHSTTVRIDYFVVDGSAPKTVEIPLERVTVEKFFDSLVERTLAVCEDVCGRGGVAPSDVDDVILVGGQSRSPIVRRKVREFFGQEPRREIHPDEAVALGAAQYAHSLGTFDSLVLIDALPMSIGVGLPGGRFKKIIERDTKLPVSRSYHIRTTHDNQESLKVVVFQGDGERVDTCDLVGTLTVHGVPKGAKGAESVEVTFEITGEGLLNLRAKVTSTGKESRTKLVTRATPEDIRMELNIPPPDPREAEGMTGAVAVTKVESSGFWGWLKRVFGGGDEGPRKSA